jgi:hypothetical protein
MANRYWVGGSGSWTSVSTINWSTTSGGSGGASVPTITDAVIINGSSGSPTITMTGALNCASLDTTGATCTLTSTGTLACAGNFTLSTTTTATSWSGALTITGTSTVTPNGRTLNNDLIINATGFTVTLAGNSIFGQGSTNSVTLTNGTLNLNSYSLTCNSFNSNNSNTRAIQFGTTGSISINSVVTGGFSISTATGFSYTGTSLINIGSAYLVTSISVTAVATLGASQALNFVFDCSTATYSEFSGNVYKNLTVNSGTLGNNNRVIYGNFTTGASCTLTGGVALTTFSATAGTQTITTNGKTWDFPLFFGTSGTPTLAFSGAFTQGSTRTFTFYVGTLQFTASTTNTVGSFVTSGSTLKYLTSSSSGTQATISQASGIVNATYLSVKDSAATGGATWNAPIASSNVDAGNNTGWSFANPTSTGNYYLIF